MMNRMKQPVAVDYGSCIPNCDSSFFAPIILSKNIHIGRHYLGKIVKRNLNEFAFGCETASNILFTKM
jgi:hypothetical protein